MEQKTVFMLVLCLIAAGSSILCTFLIRVFTRPLNASLEIYLGMVVIGTILIITGFVIQGKYLKIESNDSAMHAPLTAVNTKTSFCTNCGTPIQSNDVFCTHCGKQV